MWNETELDTLFEGHGDSLYHGKRVAFVVGVFQPGDHGLSGSDHRCELALSQTRFSARIEYHLRHLQIQPDLSDPGPHRLTWAGYRF